MKPGDIVTIKNRAGMLKVRIEKELALEDVTRGIGDDKLPSFNRPRVEYHKGRYGEHLITLCGDLTTVPFNMYLMHIDGYDDKPSCYLGVCDDTEQDVFETVY